MTDRAEARVAAAFAGPTRPPPAQYFIVMASRVG